MRLRAFVFDGDHSSRLLLAAALGRRGYEVHSFASGFVCPECTGGPCADVIVSDIRLRGGSGVDFLLGLLKSGCSEGTMALTAGSWCPSERVAAAELGCPVFTKPFALSELDDWLLAVEAAIPAERVLSGSFLHRTPHAADPPATPAP